MLLRTSTHPSEPRSAVEFGSIERAIPTNSQSEDLAGLVSRARGEDQAAFEELFRRFYPRIVRFLEKRISPAQQRMGVEADDIAQETLAKAWKSIRSYDSRYQFASWLYTIAVRTSVDQIRSLRKSGQKLRSLSDATMGNAEKEPADARTGPAALTECRDTCENIWAVAKEVLSQDQFSAMWLRYAEELSIKEIARVLKKTSVGIKVTLHRSRAALQPHLLKFANRSITVSHGRSPTIDSKQVSEEIGSARPMGDLQ